jgi:hypothetical protein
MLHPINCPIGPVNAISCEMEECLEQRNKSAVVRESNGGRVNYRREFHIL